SGYRRSPRGARSLARASERVAWLYRPASPPTIRRTTEWFSRTPEIDDAGRRPFRLECDHFDQRREQREVARIDAECVAACDVEGDERFGGLGALHLDKRFVPTPHGGGVV